MIAVVTAVTTVLMGKSASAPQLQPVNSTSVIEGKLIEYEKISQSDPSARDSSSVHISNHDYAKRYCDQSRLRMQRTRSAKFPSRMLNSTFEIAILEPYRHEELQPNHGRGESWECRLSSQSEKHLKPAMHFSQLDLAPGYWQISIKAEDREKTKFRIEEGQFYFKRKLFGLYNAPAQF